MDDSSGGQALGSGYLLQEPLGSGATGQVWRGTTREGEPVAVKVLRPELGSDPAVVARFVQEAQILTRLSGDHLVRVRDLVAEGARLGIVMDLVEGPDLRTELTRRGTFAPAEAAEVVDGLLAGLAAVHAGGVVHRDVKPENVMLEGGRPGGVRVTDFGVARIADAGTGARRTTVIGTPEYLAPEVADGGEPTPASDLYAVGVVLYELVAGVTPFAGGSPLAVLRRHVEQQPARPDGMPDAIWQVAVELLAKDPARRPAGAEAVRSRLVASAPTLAGLPPLPALATPPAPAAVSQPTVTGIRTEAAVQAAAPRSPAPAPRRRRRGMLVGLAALVAVAVAAAVVAFVVTRPADAGTDPAAAGATTSSAASTSRSTSSPRSTTPTRTTTPSPTAGSVPAVTGLTLSAAQTALTQAGLRVVTTEALDNSVNDNTVTAQDPVEGAAVERGSTVTLTVARRAVVTYLSSLQPVQTSGGDVSTQPITVNGTNYVRSVWFQPYCQLRSVQYDLGRHYRQFTAVMGLGDTSDSEAEVQFDVLVDGRNVLSQITTLGAPIDLDVDVTGGLRLEISATRVEAGCRGGDYAYAVWADAQLSGVPGEVPGSSGAPTTGTATPTR
ncbi:protein kinase [Klenkia sp. LSe6-5]|uniref:non-specific serine/threonine protein kinase n=1 Tax=Klenkia sesuvii TaxID=3103137 RepID=A0ABU8DW13_9ACTN